MAQAWNLSDKEFELIKKNWSDAIVAIPPAGGPAKAAAFGMNFRVNLIKAVQAAMQLVRVVEKATISGDDPATWPGIGLEALAAVRAVLASLVETLRPIDYVTYVLLSEHESGVKVNDLKTTVEDFLSNPVSRPFAWYLSMTMERAKLASEQAQQSNWLELSLSELEKTGMAERKDGLVFYKPKNFTVGWRIE